jgi:Baseplate J-like protein
VSNAAYAGGSAVNFNRSTPVIDYTSLDADSIAADLTRYAQATFSDRWTDFNPMQFAVVFLELVAYLGDLVTFMVNAGLRELAVKTAQRRMHLMVIAYGLGYELRAASQATAVVQVTSAPVSLPYTLLANVHKFAAGTVVFMPAQDTVVSDPVVSLDVIEGDQITGQPLGTSNGGANQRFVVPDAPLVAGSLVVFVAAVPWSRTSTFSASTPADQRYRVETDDEGVATVIFGDGVNGKLPPTSVSVTASYKVGGGVRGRVGANTIKSMLNVPVGLLSVTNPAAAKGGDDEETIEQARSAIPASLSAGDRAVTLLDYATVARAASASVSKTMAKQVDVRTVKILVAPTGGGTASDGLKNVVSAYVKPRAMHNQRVQLGDPVYVPVRVNLDLFVQRSALVSDLQTVARALFITSSPTEPQSGLLDYDNVGFGARDDEGNPQLSNIEAFVKARLGSRGVQGARLNLFTTRPQLKSSGFANSPDASLVFTVAEVDELVRRRFRVVFTSPTAYTVVEGITGASTQLTRSVLSDNRAQFPSLTGVAASINPNTAQTAALPVNEAASTDLSLVLSSPADDLYTFASVGDPYMLEWAASPPSGTVGAPFTPAKLDGDPHGFTWTINGSGFSAGDTYYVDVFRAVDAIILDEDEIPVLDPDDLVINIRNAF